MIAGSASPGTPRNIPLGTFIGRLDVIRGSVVVLLKCNKMRIGVSYRFAALALGVVLALYWARVLRMVIKARQKTGRAANFLPGERTGRLLRIVWIPVVAIWVVHPFATAAEIAQWAVLKPLYANAFIAWPAALVALVCFLASRACWKIMGKNWRMGIDPSEQTTLVLSGPYRYVRHPIYALSQAMMLATLIAIPSPLMIVVGLSHILLLQWEARREEKHLRRVHGQQYAEYCSKVGRFFPCGRLQPPMV